MTPQFSNLLRRKALLAVIFAASVIGSDQATASERNVESTESIVQQLTNHSQAKPEMRALYLFIVANHLLNGSSKAQMEAQFGPVVNSRSWYPKNFNQLVVSWAEQISLDARDADYGKTKAQTKPATQPMAAEESSLTNSAIKEALALIDSSPDIFTKLHFTFMASRLYQKLGNTDGMLQCRKILEEAFQASEKNSSVDSEQIKATASILNSMAYGFIPLRIADYQQEPKKPLKPFTEADFKASEELKLRAAAFADRLAHTDHVRRKAHRDLALWYLELGKSESAEREKQVLFELVGAKDDSLLIPQIRGCGQLVWWEKAQPGLGREFSCGMG